MLTLYCFVLGERTPFTVDIAANAPVPDLKKMIKEEKSHAINCDANMIEVYLALKGNAWLQSTSPLVERLTKGETPDEIQEYLVEANKMNPFFRLSKVLTPSPGEDQLHILVVIPESNKKQRQDGRVFISLEGIQAVDPASYQPNDWIDTKQISKVTDFPAEYFVRKQSIDVFNLLKDQTKQIVLMGSPGVGKSMLLVLYSFWMAIEGKQCVLLVRLVKGKGGKGLSGRNFQKVGRWNEWMNMKLLHL